MIKLSRSEASELSLGRLQDTAKYADISEDKSLVQYELKPKAQLRVVHRLPSGGGGIALYIDVEDAEYVFVLSDYVRDHLVRELQGDSYVSGNMRPS